MQEDFKHGSYIITQPGTYLLGEDIIFHPNGHLGLDQTQPETYLFPTKEQLAEGGKYSGPEFSLGFFAALVIAANDVTIDLMGHRIEQSPEHALMQRFYAHIETASSPFPPGAGPGAFSTPETFVSVENITIRNGILGRSSHHSIHGNRCERVSIVDMKLVDFEVAGISLNTASNVKVQNVDILNSRRDVPVNGRFSNAIYGLRTATVLLDLDEALQSTAVVKSAVETLRASVWPVIANVSKGEPVKHALFQTLTKGLPDGSLVAGLVFHPIVHVGDFLHAHQHDVYSTDITIDSVRISNLSVAPIEIAALRKIPEETESAGGYEANQVHDNAGAVLDIDTIRNPSTGKYVSNPLADLQCAMAIYKFECLGPDAYNLTGPVPRCLEKEGSEVLLKRNKISESVLLWAQGMIGFDELFASHRYALVPNFDYMFHFNKGVVGVKLDGVATASMKNVIISNLENHATLQERSIVFQGEAGYRGFDSRALAISNSVQVEGEATARSIYSNQGSTVYAVDVRNNSTGTVLKLEEAALPTSNAVLDGVLPANDPIFARSGCPFAAAQNSGSDADTTAYQTAVYALVATQIFTLFLLALGAYCVCSNSSLSHTKHKANAFKPIEELTPQDSNAVVLS